MNTYKEDFIRTISGYTQIPDDQRKLLKEIVKHQSLSKNEYFVHVDDMPQKFGYVNEGVFRVFCIAEDGNEKTMAFRSEGQFIAPYTPLLYDQKLWYSIQALTDCDIYYISISDYKFLSKNHICWDVLEKNYIIELFKEKEERERSLLMDSAESRYKNFIENHPKLTQRIQQNYIASYLGITPVSLSRLKSQINV